MSNSDSYADPPPEETVLPLDLRLATHAGLTPDKPAVVTMNGGPGLSYRELEDSSRLLASAFLNFGLVRGDTIAILLDNSPAYFVVAWAAQRAGLVYTPVSWHLSADEVTYVVEDSGARMVVSTERLLDLAVQAARAPLVQWRLLVEGTSPGWTPLGEVLADTTASDDIDQVEGQWMFYSSGTTGRPKGIIRPEMETAYGTGTAIDRLLGSRFGFDAETVYLSPAPLYHASPLGWSMGTHRRGGTVVILDSFDPVRTLEAIEQHAVTHAQFVPTMFTRMLKLPDAVRTGFRHSSLRMVVHAAAPCPIEVKTQMLDWWGPIIHEYYAGSEGIGFVAIGPHEWLAHPGSVGRSLRGPVHIVDEHGKEVETNEVGTIWFEGGSRFEYHGDPEKTQTAFNSVGWGTLGDVGYLDGDGFLYLTDRATDLILSGGVNVYPQEVERVLLQHDSVLDAGVVGVPDPDLGEHPVAFVQLVEGAVPGPHLAQELQDLLAAKLARVKRPRSITYVDELPRLPTGKLLRRHLRGRTTAPVEGG